MRCECHPHLLDCYLRLVEENVIRRMNNEIVLWRDGVDMNVNITDSSRNHAFVQNAVATTIFCKDIHVNARSESAHAARLVQLV